LQGYMLILRYFRCKIKLLEDICNIFIASLNYLNNDAYQQKLYDYLPHILHYYQEAKIDPVSISENMILSCFNPK